MRTRLSKRLRNALAGTFGAMVVLGSTSIARAQCALGELPPPDDWVRTNYFGAAVAISGNLALVGAPGSVQQTEPGAVYAYHFDGARWIEEGKLVRPGPAMDDQFGTSIAMAGDIAIIGAPYLDFTEPDTVRCRSGAVYVYRRAGGEWTLETSFVASETVCGDKFGRPIAYDGTTLVVGVRYRAELVNDELVTEMGAAYVFRQNGLDWIEEATLKPEGLEYQDGFGVSVSVLGDVIAVGEYHGDGQAEGTGAAYIYRHDGADWVEEAKISGSRADQFDNAAYVAVGQGFALLGGARVGNGLDTGPFDQGEGVVHVFRNAGTTWTEESVLISPTAIPGEHTGGFGNFLLIQDDLIALGAPYDDSTGVETGAVHLYRWTESEISFQNTLFPAAPISERRFGGSSDVSGDLLLVGARTNDQSFPESPPSAEVFLLTDSPGDPDCNTNGTHDSCDVFQGTSLDCNENWIPDECDLASGSSEDCNTNGVPDECEPDCNNNGILDSCDIADATSADCNANGVPDACDIAEGSSPDCNINDTPDECDVATGASVDCNQNGIPDECDPQDDCNANSVQDICDVFVGTSNDCNFDGVPDECQPDEDCNANGTSDICDIGAGTSSDCNVNLVPDSCDISSGTSFDVDNNGRPDECCLLPPTSPSMDRIPDNLGVLQDNKKGRMLPIVVNDSGREFAIQVEFVSLPAPYDIWNGAVMFARAPIDVCETSSLAGPPFLCAIDTYVTAKLGCTDTPFFTDWNSLGVVNVWHEGVVPGGTYNVRVIDSLCVFASANFSGPTEMQTARFGDTVGSAGYEFPVDNAVDIIDALAGIAAFVNAVNKPSKSRTELDYRCIDHRANIGDVLSSLQGFFGVPYQFTPSTPDPCAASCPDP